MVDSIPASAPYYSYLNQIQGVQNTTQPPATSPTEVTPTSASSENDETNTPPYDVSSAVAALIAGNGFKPEILSLLQNNSSGTFDPVSSLLNQGTSSDSGITTLLTNLYDTSLNAAITQAKNKVPQPIVPSETPAPPVGADLIDHLLDSLSQASVAYNTTIQQNIQNSLNNSSPGTIPPITT